MNWLKYFQTTILLNSFKPSRALFSLVCVLALSGCFSNLKKPPPEQTIVYKDKLVKITCPVPPTAAPFIMRDAEPTAIADKFGIYWVAFTPKHYENLSQNMSDLLRFIRNQSKIVAYFKKCIADTPEKLDVQ